MKAIDFVARRGMGVVERGTVAADAAETVVNMGAGVEFSLNLQPGDMQAYSRQGNNLEIVLADGRVIILDGYFVGGGENPNRIFISSGGTLNEISFIEGADGALFAQYGTTAEWGKWSPDDDLIFVDDPNLIAATGVDGDQDVSMLGAALLGGAGLLGTGGIGAGAIAAGAAGAALLATSGGAEPTEPTVTPEPVDPTDPTPVPPVVGPVDPRVPPTIDGNGRTDSYGGDNLVENDKTITVTGTAEPGSNVSVVVAGVTVATVAAADGSYSATFDGTDFPADGTYTAKVTVVEDDGTTTALTGQQIVIDTTPPVVDPTEGTLSSGDKINAAAHDTGTIEVAGTGEAGSTVAVTIQGTTHSTTVNPDGSWSVDFASSEIAGGNNYDTDVTIVTTDSFGNSHTQTETMVIDTVAPIIGASSGTTAQGYTVNHNDMTSDGVAVVSGTGEAGASYRIELNNGSGAVRTGTIGGDGTWSASFTQAELGGLSDADGYDVPFTMTSIDSFGNPSTPVQNTIHVDTLAEVGIATNVSGGNDHVANNFETGGGAKNLVLTGTSEPGTTAVAVTMNGHTRSATVNPTTGEWTVNFEPGTYDTGTNTYPATAVATDAAGNTSPPASMSVRVDTEVTDLTASNTLAYGGDGVVGLDDAEGGITLTGTMETNWTDVNGVPTVTVRFNGQDFPVDSFNTSTGAWSVKIPETAIPTGYSGSYDYFVTGVDSVGNSSTITQSIVIDTKVPEGSDVIGYSADFDNGTLEYEDFDIQRPSENLDIARVEVNGAVTDLVADANGVMNDYGTDNVRNEPDQLRIELSDTMSNGQNLIVTESDTAGNTSGTYVILDGGPASQDLSNGNLGDYQIDTVNLGAADVSLTLTEADIKALSSNSDSLTIRGEAKAAGEADSGDSVTLLGASQGNSVSENGVDYNVYTLGDATIYIEDEITNVTI